MAVGRFQVMSVLQAARAHVLGLPLESAHSWGLNRAIFIAAAKRGFRGGGEGEGRGRGSGSREKEIYYLGDDMAYKEEKGGVLRFTMGGKTQTEEDYENRVKARFGKAYDAAWKEALAYVKGFERETLLSADGFFGVVYRPRRDELAAHWTEMAQR